MTHTKLTIADLDAHARAIREHERHVRQFGTAARCAANCPHETAPSVEDVRRDLGDEIAMDWGLFLAGEGTWS